MFVIYLICLFSISSAVAMQAPSNRSGTESTQKTPQDLTVILSRLQVWRVGFASSAANRNPKSLASKKPSYPALSINPDLVPVLFATEWAYPNQDLSTENQR